MACEICGRNACTESFHSLSEQQEYEEIFGDKDSEIEELKRKINWLDKAYDILWSHLPPAYIPAVEKELEKLGKY